MFQALLVVVLLVFVYSDEPPGTNTDEHVLPPIRHPVLQYYQPSSYPLPYRHYYPPYPSYKERDHDCGRGYNNYPFEFFIIEEMFRKNPYYWFPLLFYLSLNSPFISHLPPPLPTFPYLPPIPPQFPPLLAPPLIFPPPPPPPQFPPRPTSSPIFPPPPPPPQFLFPLPTPPKDLYLPPSHSPPFSRVPLIYPSPPSFLHPDSEYFNMSDLMRRLPHKKLKEVKEIECGGIFEEYGSCPQGYRCNYEAYVFKGICIKIEAPKRPSPEKDRPPKPSKNSIPLPETKIEIQEIECGGIYDEYGDCPDGYECTHEAYVHKGLCKKKERFQFNNSIISPTEELAVAPRSLIIQRDLPIEETECGGIYDEYGECPIGYRCTFTTYIHKGLCEKVTPSMPPPRLFPSRRCPPINCEGIVCPLFVCPYGNDPLACGCCHTCLKGPSESCGDRVGRCTKDHFCVDKFLQEIRPSRYPPPREGRCRSRFCPDCTLVDCARPETLQCKNGTIPDPFCGCCPACKKGLGEECGGDIFSSKGGCPREEALVCKDDQQMEIFPQESDTPVGTCQIGDGLPIPGGKGDCPNCAVVLCLRPECDYGIGTDPVCGCCPVCLKGPGESCGVNNENGQCGDGLRCDNGKCVKIKPPCLDCRLVKVKCISPESLGCPDNYEISTCTCCPECLKNTGY